MRLHVNFSSYLIQQIRLIHALAETRYQIVLPESEKIKYERLGQYFNAHFLFGEEWDFEITEFLTIDHATPLTSAFGIERPLIFPHAIPRYCRTLWKEKRSYPFLFVGLLTDKRKTVLENWLKTHFGKDFRFDASRNLVSRARRKLALMLGLAKGDGLTKIKGLTVWPSMNGREFPIKSWDNDYYEMLSKARFVLCPNGDYVWTYRFFEAILCGAIPVVESDCAAYAGFRYYFMHENPRQFEWRAEDVLHNYSLCVEKITVPLETLEQRIAESLNR